MARPNVGSPLMQRLGDSEPSLMVKVHYGEEVRKMPLEWQPSLEELSTLLRDTFRLDHPTVKYKDEDGDIITIKTDLELNNAFSESKRTKQSMRLYLGEEKLLSKTTHELPSSVSPSSSVDLRSSAPGTSRKQDVNNNATPTTTSTSTTTAANTNSSTSNLPPIDYRRGVSDPELLPRSNRPTNPDLGPLYSSSTSALPNGAGQRSGSAANLQTSVGHREIPQPNNGNKSETSGGAVPESVIPADPDFVGWCGEISRQEAEDRLKGAPDKTFLTRWSSRPGSYVLSYNNGLFFDHIAHIKPKDGHIVVCKTDNSTSSFKDLTEYIRKMKHIKVIGNPVQTSARGQEETPYTSLGEVNNPKK